MRTENTRQHVTMRLNILILVGVFIIVGAVVAVPVYSVRSSSLPIGSSQARAKVSQISVLPALNSNGARWSSATLRSVLPVPTSSPETIETYASDCTTPKTAFVLGETVCAVVNFVTETDRFVNWLSPPSSTVVFSSPTIPDNFTHSYLYQPLVAGTWKATIADGSDSSIVPTVFTVQSQSGSLRTFEYTAGSCTTTPKVSFNLGETVCAKIIGAGQPVDSRATTRVGWVSPYGSLTQGAEIVSDPQTSTYAIPITATETFTDAGGGSTTVDNRGVWRLILQSASDGSLIESTDFTVHDPTREFVDLSLHQSETLQESDVNSGSGSVFRLFVTNRGPDTAHTVVLTDTVPANTTFTSMAEDTNLGFTCHTPVAGVFTCELAAMPRGATAEFTFAYDVMSGTPEGTPITNNASIGSSNTPCVDTPCELQPDDNASTATSKVPVATGGETCTLTCHANFSVVADVFQGATHGAYVFFGAAGINGSCGAIDATFAGIPFADPPTDPPSHIPASGAFYPVGTTVIQVSSATGGGSCSFTITVVEGTPPTITCPPDKTATASTPGGSHTFTAPEIGLPMSDPTGLVVTFERSDNIQATYDANGDVATPAVVYSLTDPFPSGSTGINWTVTDSNGLAASCTQRILVHDPCATDTGPPTIVACGPLGTETGTACAVTVSTGPNSTTCGVALSPSDNELGTPVVHDDCSAVVTTTGIPAGNLFPVGNTTLTYTATDGAGHTASATQLVTVVDNTVPVIVAPANANYVCLSQVPAANVSQAHGNNPALPNGGPVFDNCGILSVTVSDSSTGVGSGASPKIITRTYTATDIHGNSANAVQVITVIDAVPPTFTFVPGARVAYTGAGATSCGTTVTDATLGAATATDNCSVVVTRSGVPAGNVFPKGDTTVTYTATDSAGNTAIATQLVTVIDDTPPTISCLADIIVDFNPAVTPAGATVNFTAPVGTDNCPGATTAQTAGLPSGSVFPLGTTTNTFTVTDTALPVHNSASCSFKVTVALTSIIGLDSVSISGASFVDSYASNLGYPASKSSLANVLSNGTITLAGSAKVWGNVRSTRVGVAMSGASQVTGNATAGTTVTRTGSATVGGTITNNALAPVMTLPSVPACTPFSSNSGITGTYTYNASTGDLSLSGVNIATLANGNYCFHNVTVSGSSQLKVNGLVVIKMTGTLNTSGASSVPNTTSIPSNLRILSSYTGSNGVNFGASSNVHLVIYAPNTGVTISGATPLFGTVVGKTLTISGSGAIHYDTQLKTIWPAVWTLIFGP